MRLIEQLLAVDDQGGRADALIRKDGIFTDLAGRQDPTAHLELLAQTFAAVEGLHQRQRGIPPRVGYLVGADDLIFHDTAHAGDRLTVAIRTTERLGPFVLLDGQVYLQDRCLAEGRLKLWVDPSGSVTAKALRTAWEAPLPSAIPLDDEISGSAVGPWGWVTPGIVTQSFCLPRTLSAFQGHFPDAPVLPAFAQVRLGMLMLKASQRRSPVLQSIDRAKFREPLRPEQTVAVRCRLEDRTETDAYPASVKLTVAGRPVSAFQLTVRSSTPASL